MADILTHYVVSYILLRRVFGLKLSLLIALVALLPDIDVIFRIHRWFTHSIIVLGLGVLCLVVLFTLHRGFRGFLLYLGAIALVYLLHIVVDLFTASTPILWPLISESYHLKILVQGFVAAEDKTISIYPIMSVITSASNFTPRDSLEGPIATGLSIILALATLILELFEFADMIVKNKFNG
ncbi:MAG: metal-dependent hydrolase [Ignisphaera sp.]|uniref:Metal-dependent hydrolase n=1 Tax=Ignisphaera aggregans TaxID=334771 RepID=A0A7C4JIB1_9CREN